jgi:hypothetical protein
LIAIPLDTSLDSTPIEFEKVTFTPMNRPYFRYTVQELEMVFEYHRANPTLLRELHAELGHRTRRRSIQLLEKIENVLKNFADVDSPLLAIGQHSQLEVLAKRNEEWTRQEAKQNERRNSPSRYPANEILKPTQPAMSQHPVSTSRIDPAEKSVPSKPVDSNHGWKVALALIAAFVLVFGVLASERGSRTAEKGTPKSESIPKVQLLNTSASTPSNVSGNRSGTAEQTTPVKQNAAVKVTSSTSAISDNPSDTSSASRTKPSGVSSSLQFAEGTPLSYESYIPRPTLKGYYEPKVIPYPTGKPVYVSGYYRKNGTYVSPHFRSLPRR